MAPLVYTHDEMLQRLCKVQNRPGLYLRFRFPDDVDDPAVEVCRAVPLLGTLPAAAKSQLLADGFGFVFFEGVEAMHQAFEQILGPDGPKQHQAYHGPAHAYAVACDAAGRILGDNTESSSSGGS